MKRTASVLLCAVMLASVLAGCTVEDTPYVPTGDALDSTDQSPNVTQPSANQELVMAYYPDRSMNPYSATDFTNRALFPLIYQSLFNVDRDYNVVPILCETFTVSADMKTHTFTIAAATFSDGTALTASDVAASLQAAKSGAYYSGRFLHISSIQASGNSVVITTDTPCQDLTILLDVPIVKASEVNSATPLGTGPYIMDKPLSGIQLRRRSDWWCDAELAVTAPFIPLVEAGSPSQIRDQFEFADVGLVCADPGSDTYADYRCDYEIWDCENGLFLYLVCNSKSEIFANESVRTALTHAIDRDALVEDYYRGFARSASLPASPLSPYYDEALAARFSYDSTSLTDALTQADLQGAKVTLLLNSGDSRRLRAGRAIAEMLRVCGLEVTITEVKASEFTAALNKGEYDLYLGQTRLSANMDLTAFFAQKGSLNYGGLADTATYALCLESLANSGNYYNLHNQVMESGWLCPILFRSYAVYATRGLITDLTPSRDNLFCYSLGRDLDDARVAGE